MSPCSRVHFVIACLFTAAIPSLVSGEELTSGRSVKFAMTLDDKLPTTTDGWFGRAFTFTVAEPSPFKVVARPKGTGRTVFLELLSPSGKSLGNIHGSGLTIDELPARGEYQLNVSSQEIGDITITATFTGKDSGDKSGVASNDVVSLIDELSEDVANLEKQLVAMRAKLDALRAAAGEPNQPKDAK